MATSLLDQTTIAFEDLRNPSWRNLQGAPKRWMCHDGRRIRLLPSQAGTATVGYLESPAILADPSDVPDARIPVPHHAYLKFAAAAWLLRQDGDQADEEKAQSFMNTFNSLIGVSHG